jgi:DNA-binding NarL/FixJ family response regulator
MIAAPRKQVLLVEPHSLFRGTLASIARQLKGVDVHETSSHDAARVILETQRIDCLMLNAGEDLAGLAVLKALRAGQTINRRELPTALLAETLDADAVESLRELRPRRIMLMPFKVRTAFEVIGELMAGLDEPPALLRA